jgi:predicted ATPase
MANLADVGYGVSQALPVVVQSVIGPSNGILLLQQPEVHLHPKAQAALGTFFAQLVASQQKQFIIETHSDYLVDRVRQEVAQGTLDPSDVALLFFERGERGSKVVRIEIDRMGNLATAPKKYREFFLKEQMRLLTRG